MSESMIEKAARAAAESLDGLITDGEAMTVTRAVLAAIRSPDEAMVNAGLAAAGAHEGTAVEVVAVMWPAMVDAICGEAP